MREELIYYPPDFSATVLEAAPGVTTEAAAADGVVPRTFYATTNYPTYVKHAGAWRLVKRQRMDAAIVQNAETGEFECTEMRKVRAGQPVVVAGQGALWPDGDPLELFALATAAGNLWMGLGVWRERGQTGPSSG